MNILERADALIQGANDMKSEIGVFGTEQYNKGWDEAMAQAGSGGSSDKIYSEAEMNQIIADTKAPLEAQVQQIQAALDSVPASIEEAKVQAKAEVKAELKAAYDAQQVAESQGETGFGDLLK